MGGARLRTVVADTSALVSLAVPRADPEYDTEPGPDPLAYLLTSCTVSVPKTVVSELHELAGGQDIHGAAASNVLTARSHYAIADPYERAETPESRPTFDLDDGETDGIVLANAIGADGFLTDEFGGTNFPIIHAVLDGPRLVPSPRLVRDFARNGHMTREEARTVISSIGAHRSWDGNPYVARTLDRLR